VIFFLGFLLGFGLMPSGAGEDIQDELDRLGDELGPPGTVENIAARARIRRLLSRLMEEARAGGPREAEALQAIARVAVSRKRTLAMEGSLALLAIPGPSGLRTFLGVLRVMDPAAARQTLDMVIAQGLDVSGIEKELLGLLESESRPELASRLVELASSLKTVEAARAVLRAAPPPGAGGTAERGEWLPGSAGTPEPRPALEEAVDRALDRLGGGPASSAARDWLAAGAFREAAGRPGAAAALARAVSRGALEAPRALVLGLLEVKDDAARLEVLHAVDRLEPFTLSAESSGAVVDLLGPDRPFPSPAVVRRASWLLARGNAARAAMLLSGRAGDPSWEVRRAAAEGLAELSPEQVAFQAVLSLLDDQNREVRRAAFEAVGSFPRKEAVDRAIGILGSGRGPRREEALAWLERAAGARRGADPREWERWWASAREGFTMPPAPLVRRGASRETARGVASWKLTPLLAGRSGPGDGSPGRLSLAMHTFLAEGPGGEVVLIDPEPKALPIAGAGGSLHADGIVQERGGVLALLRARGIGLERVRHIVFTDLPAGHHGLDGARDGGPVADFPQALFHVSRRGRDEQPGRRRAAAGGSSQPDRASPDILLTLGESGRCLFEDDGEVVPGIRTVYLGGRSPCSQAVVVDTASGPAVIAREVDRYALLEEGVLVAPIPTSPRELVVALDRLAGLALDQGAILLPAQEARLAGAYEKDGEKWLLSLRAVSDRAAWGYRERRRLGALRLAEAAEEGTQE
jgi:HEAT repeat protein